MIKSHIISTDEDRGLRIESFAENITWCFHKHKVLYVLSPCNPAKNLLASNLFLRYIVLAGNHTVPYFNAILIRTSTVQTKATSLKIVPFETSIMGRHYLIHPIKFADTKIIVMTSHLESLVDNGAERKKQFSEILDYMKRQNENFNVIFGGDTNLRDTEVNAVGGVPSGILDAWASCGSALTTKYTWNMAGNNNNGKAYQRPPKLRFDRIFVRPAKEAKTIKPSTFSLVGKERLKNCKRFASDHWAIWLELSVQ